MMLLRLLRVLWFASVVDVVVANETAVNLPKWALEMLFYSAVGEMSVLMVLLIGGVPLLCFRYRPR